MECKILCKNTGCECLSCDFLNRNETADHFKIPWMPVNVQVTAVSYPCRNIAESTLRKIAAAIMNGGLLHMPKSSKAQDMAFGEYVVAIRDNISNGVIGYNAPIFYRAQNDGNFELLDWLYIPHVEPF